MKKLIHLLILLNLITILFVLNSCEIVFALNFSADTADIFDEEYNFANLNADFAAESLNPADSTGSPKKEVKEVYEVYDMKERANANSSSYIYDINPKFYEYLKINGDIAGNIKIKGTAIDFPVVFNNDNEYYLTNDIYKNKNRYGAVFMDESNRGAILDKNTLLHAHNFKDGLMFSDLEKYKDTEFFENHKTILFDNLYSEMEWEVFSVYVVSGEINEKNYYMLTSFDSYEAYADYINLIKSKSLIWSEYIPQPGDYMLTLHTCSYEFIGAHTVIHAKLINKTDNLK